MTSYNNVMGGHGNESYNESVLKTQINKSNQFFLKYRDVSDDTRFLAFTNLKHICVVLIFIYIKAALIKDDTSI